MDLHGILRKAVSFFTMIGLVAVGFFLMSLGGQIAPLAGVILVLMGALGSVIYV